MKLRLVKENEINKAIEIINEAKDYLKKHGVNQWQEGYPDDNCIRQDIENNKGFFIEDEEILGYLCIDYDGEPAYKHLNGKWQSDDAYVVIHRLAFTQNARGKGMSDMVFQLVEEMSKQKGVYSFRIDTDADNQKMQHILKKNNFKYRGTIWFDNSEKIAFDKTIIQTISIDEEIITTAKNANVYNFMMELLASNGEYAI